MFKKWVHRVYDRELNKFIYIYYIVPRIGYHKIQQHSQLNPQFNTKLRWAKLFFPDEGFSPVKDTTISSFP